MLCFFEQCRRVCYLCVCKKITSKKNFFLQICCESFLQQNACINWLSLPLIYMVHTWCCVLNLGTDYADDWLGANK